MRKTLFLLLASTLVCFSVAQTKESPTADSNAAKPIAKATFADLKSIELNLPLGLDLNVIHGSRSNPVIFTPSLSYSRDQLEFGTRFYFNLNFKKAEGGSTFFVHLRIPWAPNRRSVNFIGPEIGWSYFDESEGARFGLRFGKIVVRGGVDHPGILRFQAHLAADLASSRSPAFIAGIGLSFGVPL